ncbi:MAG TPA: glycosyltransferase [Candidatus Limnocylindria bacterium]|nr:glycosyltransferase [Candidatus Limnocylindria bacterium]
MRIALAAVGTTGDVRPFASLATALAGAGHEVSAISWELHRDAFATTGATFVPAGPATTADDVRRTAVAAAAARSPLAQVGILRDFHLRDGAEHQRALREALRGHEVAVVHGIHALAVAAARDEGVRFATAVFDPVLLPTRTAPPPGMPGMGPLNGFAWWMLDRAMGSHDRALATILRAAGSTSTGQSLFRDRSPLLHMVAVSPTIAPPPADLASSALFTGPWRPVSDPTPLPADLEAFMSSGTPPVVVTFGSMALRDAPAAAKQIREALDRSALRGVIQAGATGFDGTSDETVRFVEEVDHRALLPRAGVVVHHGGAGTTHAAVAAGVPSVVIPQIGDQRYWAARLQALGVAPAPLRAGALSAASLAERLTAAAGMAERAQRLATQVAGESGLATATHLVEERLGLRA